jgi:NAD+ diphosphatase
VAIGSARAALGFEVSYATGADPLDGPARLQPVLITFSGAGLDRCGPRRGDAEWVASRREDPGSRLIGVTPRGVALDPGAGTRLARLPMSSAEDAEAVLLGLDDDRALFAAWLDDAPSVVGVRSAAAALAAPEAAIAAQAAALLNWHRSHPRCSRCGAQTAMADAGYLRRCPACGASHHPRTDPVVIMLVVEGDRVLLGRQASWPQRRYSALAGFVEPGESLEEAVAREVAEESGVQVRDVRYIASQPWPFPASLMLGFIAEWAAGTPAVRDGELEDVRWFTRDEVREAAAERGPLLLPAPVAIARRLLDVWLEA